jgi:hypothetical protein
VALAGGVRRPGARPAAAPDDPRRDGVDGRAAASVGQQERFRRLVNHPFAFSEETAMYDPNTGRWLQPDPEGFDAQDPNLDRFVGNDPTNATDPTGLQEILPLDWLKEVQRARFKELQELATRVSREELAIILRMEHPIHIDEDIDAPYDHAHDWMPLEHTLSGHVYTDLDLSGKGNYKLTYLGKVSDGDDAVEVRFKIDGESKSFRPTTVKGTIDTDAKSGPQSLKTTTGITLAEQEPPFLTFEGQYLIGDVHGRSGFSLDTTIFGHNASDAKLHVTGTYHYNSDYSLDAKVTYEAGGKYSILITGYVPTSEFTRIENIFKPGLEFGIENWKGTIKFRGDLLLNGFHLNGHWDGKRGYELHLGFPEHHW